MDNALAFQEILGFQGFNAVPCSPASEASNGGGDNGTETAKTPVKNTSRERRKAEKQLLTKQVAELERDLTGLLSQKAVVRCATPPGVWRSLATRQYARRARAQDENQRLKARLLHQLQVAKTLQTVLRNRAGTFLDTRPSSHSVGDKYPVNDLAALHELCLDKIDQLYMQVDAVLDEGSRSVDYGQQPLRHTKLVDEKLCVDMHDSNYAPFPFANVCNAIWRAITTEFERQDRLIEEYRSTDDEYTSKSRLPVAATVPETGEQFSATMTMRKFSEDTRMVLVWHGLEIKETAEGSSVDSSETGWLVAERASDPVTGDPSEDGTVIRVCTRHTPITESTRARGSSLWAQSSETDHNEVPSSLRGFTSRLMQGAEADIASITEAVETILLDEAIGARDIDVEAVVRGLWLLPEQEVGDTSTLGLQQPKNPSLIDTN